MIANQLALLSEITQYQYNGWSSVRMQPILTLEDKTLPPKMRQVPTRPPLSIRQCMTSRHASKHSRLNALVKEQKTRQKTKRSDSERERERERERETERERERERKRERK